MVLVPVARRAAAVGALVWLVLAVGGLGQALLVSAVVPDLDLLVRMFVGAAGAGASLALPLGALGGLASGLRQLADDRAWLGLRALGVGGRALLPPVGGFLVVVAAGWLGVTHLGEPLARATLREARIAAAVRVVPVEGRVVALGAWSAAVEHGVLHFAGGEWRGKAASWALRPALTGVVVELRDGEILSRDGASRARFATLDMPISLGGSGGKVHASERTTPDLQRQLAVSAALGRDAYERWILWKRTLLPLCFLPIGLAVPPLALRGRWPLLGLVGAPVGLVWGAVRVADQSVAGVGLPGVTSAVCAVALGWLLYAWRGWRDA